MVQPSQIHPFELKRLLIGQAPSLFLAEIAVRAVVTYIVLLVAARAMGKRVAGQMSVLELTIVVTLGAAIGVPLETPERGIVPAIIVLAIAVGYQRLVGLATVNSRRAVATLEGTPETLVRDGAIELRTMKRASISRERLFAILRNREVLHLGQVKRAYLEASGQLSVYLADEPRPGLCLLPGTDRIAYERRFAEAREFACRSCGNVIHADGEPPDACPICRAHHWTAAVRTGPIRELRDEQAMHRAAR
jgi:uncharacterized membrane protein YcaP (DUF421 family)